jgi:uncharacterized protein (TIGR03083 family)
VTADPTNKAEFQKHLLDAWAQLQHTLDSLNDEQMTERTDAGGWTVKDHIAHLIPWERGMIALLKKEPRYEAMGLDAQTVKSNDEGELNRMLRAQLETAPLAEVREQLRTTHEALAALIDSLGADDLLKPYSHYQPDEPGDDRGEPVLNWVVGNSSGHYLEHLPWIRQLAGTG